MSETGETRNLTASECASIWERVYNEPQPDGTVIQYDRPGGQPIAYFDSDEACMDAMGIPRPTSPLAEFGTELREAVGDEFRHISERLIGGRPHAA